MEDFTSLSLKTVAELRKIAQHKKLTDEPKITKSLFLTNSQPVNTGYYDRCLQQPINVVEQITIDAKHHPGNKTKEELCRNVLPWKSRRTI